MGKESGATPPAAAIADAPGRAAPASLEELRAKRDAAAANGDHATSLFINDRINAIKQWQREAANADLLAEVVEALAPLAGLDVAHVRRDLPPEETILWQCNESRLTLADVLNARAALSKATGGQS